MPLHHCVMDSPIGTLHLFATDRGVRFISWSHEDDARAALSRDGLVEHASDGAGHTVLERLVDQLGEYFAGDRQEFDVDLDPVGTEFQKSAWAALRTIPFGATTSYGEQARRMGDARKARAVGAANGRNPIPIVVPCHRVVGANGSLTGFAGGLDTKAWLLDHERAVLVGAR